MENASAGVHAVLVGLSHQDNKQFEDDRRSFCSAACRTAFQAKQESLQRAQEEAAARRAQVEAEAEMARSAEQGRTASRLGTPLKVEEAVDHD